MLFRSLDGRGHGSPLIPLLPRPPRGAWGAPRSVSHDCLPLFFAGPIHRQKTMQNREAPPQGGRRFVPASRLRLTGRTRFWNDSGRQVEPSFIQIEANLRYAFFLIVSRVPYFFSRRKKRKGQRHGHDVEKPQGPPLFSQRSKEKEGVKVADLHLQACGAGTL